MKSTNLLGAGLAAAAIATAFLGSCTVKKSMTISTAPPTFSLAWSEYPSWSVFGVADALDLIDGKEGKLGEIETKWNVDIVLKQMDYDSCLGAYGTGTVDAVCITNMDILSPSLQRASVAVLPTSTSVGGDACIVVGIDTIQDLKGKKVYGLEKSVSEYCFVRNLEIAGEKEADYNFTQMMPDAAATAMQTKAGGVDAIVVWNPFVMSTLQNRSDAKRLFDSSTIPEEIIDMLVVAKASLEKDGGDRFAAAAIDAFYAINKRMADPAKREETLVALGEKFSALDAAAMETVVTETRFYENAQDGSALFAGETLKATMTRVLDFCASHGMTDSKPSLGYGSAADAPNANLRFDASYMEKAQAGH